MLPQHILQNIYFFSISSALPTDVLEDIKHYHSTLSTVLSLVNVGRYRLLHEVIVETLNGGVPVYLYISFELKKITKRHSYLHLRERTKKELSLTTFFQIVNLFLYEENIHFEKVFSSLFLTCPNSFERYKRCIRIIFSLLCPSEREFLIEKVRAYIYDGV
jgi:hypothetical protein